MKERFSELIGKTDITSFIWIDPPALDYEKIKANIDIGKESKSSFSKPHGKTKLSVMLAAAIVLLLVSFPVIVFMTKHNDTSDISDSHDTSTVSENGKSALESIRLKRLYGEVALSKKSESELESILTRYENGAQVFEDERYVYNFGSDGELIEMYATDYSRKSANSATEQEIHEKALEALEMYFPEHPATDYTMYQLEHPDQYTDRMAVFTRKAADNTSVRINMVFFEDGELKALNIVGSEKSVGKLSRKKAIDIASELLNSEHYSFLSYDEMPDITVDTGTVGDSPYYSVTFTGLKVEHGSFDGWNFVINAQTGELLRSHELNTTKATDINGNKVSYWF